MDILQLGKDVDATAVAAQAAVEPTQTPFIAGREAIAVVSVDGVTGAPSIKVQGSDDGVTWSDLVTVAAQGPAVLAKVTVQAQMRLNVATAATAGKVSAYLLGDL